MFLFMFFLGSNAFACQNMNYDPWVHYILEDRELVDSNGIMLWKHDNGRIYGVHFASAGRKDGNKVYDCNGSLVARNDSGRIYNSQGSLVFKIEGDRIYNANGSLVANIKGSIIYNANGTKYGEMN